MQVERDGWDKSRYMAAWRLRVHAHVQRIVACFEVCLATIENWWASDGESRWCDGVSARSAVLGHRRRFCQYPHGQSPLRPASVSQFAALLTIFLWCFIPTLSYKYPTDFCTNNTFDLDCFTRGILDAKAQADSTPFLITEYSCGWKNSAIHGGESTAYAASFALRTVTALAASGLEALSWWTFSMLCASYPEILELRLVSMTLTTC